ncbi:hypothetical protein D3C73_474860 [compost metagenome]
MKFRAVSQETKLNYMMWSIKQEIRRENQYLSTLGYDPQPIIDVVKHHIDDWDPIQLLAMDCPADEYDGETRTITIYITKHLQDMDNLSLSERLNKVFKSSFNDEYSRDKESILIASNLISSRRTKNLIK